MAVESDPRPHVLDTLAEAYFVNGLFQEAIVTIKRALSGEPENGEYKGYFQEQLERFEKAPSEAKAVPAPSHKGPPFLDAPLSGAPGLALGTFPSTALFGLRRQLE